MKLERIDSNTLHIMLSKADLDDRKITMSDLMSDRQRVEKFFYSILDEANVDHSFVNDDQVTFQIMPTGKQGIELFISRVVDDSNMSVDGDGNMIFSIKDEEVDGRIVNLLQGYDKSGSNSDRQKRISSNRPKYALTSSQPSGSTSASSLDTDDQKNTFMYDGWYLLSDFDEFLAVGQTIDSKFLVSDLYEIRTAFPHDGNDAVHRAFLLHLFSRNKKAGGVENLMSDFGIRVDSSQIESSDLTKPVFTNLALELSKNIFKN
ncbi:adaptor protein MecA [Oenococcus alcoholitolerans]|uniref:adaptor protein MecA n=1 Tax=Oenococcus alcoholitolerans TaxID=931074 RepID=UPI003F71CA86